MVDLATAGDDWAELYYRRVRLSGVFEPAHQVYLDNRMHAGRVGYHVICPVAFGDRAVLVNRGWLAAGADRSIEPRAPTPAGERTVAGMLVPASSRYLELAATPATGRVWQNLDLARYRDWSGRNLPDAVILQTSASADGLARDWPRPDAGVARHQGYAAQWFALTAAIAALYAYYGIRRPRRMRDEGCADAPPPGGEGLGVRVPGAAWPKADHGKLGAIAGARIRLLLLLALFAAPAMAAWLAHHVWRPAGGQSYGELLEPQELAPPGLVDAAGQPADLAELRGRWVLLTVTQGACAADCQALVHLTRQARLALGRDQGRLARALIGTGEAPPDEPDLRVFTLPAEALGRLHALSAPAVYVLDPLGRLMLRFPPRPDGKAVIGDLRRLLKASHIG